MIMYNEWNLEINIFSLWFYNVYIFYPAASVDGNSSMDRWLSRVESCCWLGHIKDSLTCACVAAQCIDKEG